MPGWRLTAPVRPFSAGRRDQYSWHLHFVFTAYSNLALCSRIFYHFCCRRFVLCLDERTIFFHHSPNEPDIFPLFHYLHDKFHPEFAVIDILRRDIGHATDHCASGRFGRIYTDKFFQL